MSKAFISPAVTLETTPPTPEDPWLAGDVLVVSFAPDGTSTVENVMDEDAFEAMFGEDTTYIEDEVAELYDLNNCLVTVSDLMSPIYDSQPQSLKMAFYTYAMKAFEEIDGTAREIIPALRALADELETFADGLEAALDPMLAYIEKDFDGIGVKVLDDARLEDITYDAAREKFLTACKWTANEEVLQAMLGAQPVTDALKNDDDGILTLDTDMQRAADDGFPIHLHED